MYVWDRKLEKFVKKEKDTTVKNKTFSFRTTEDDAAQIDRITKAYKLSASDLIGQMVHLFLEKFDWSEVGKEEWLEKHRNDPAEVYSGGPYCVKTKETGEASIQNE